MQIGRFLMKLDALIMIICAYVPDEHRIIE